jgi:aminocarboxymuconate-semialdehyde decarboxylase
VIVDICAHIHPPRFVAATSNSANSYMRKRVTRVQTLQDLDARFRIMDSYSAYDYRQLLTLALPALSTVTTKESHPEVCRAVNEELQELVLRYPDRFVGAFGELPFNDPDSVHREVEHMKELGMPGFQMHTNVNGRPVDAPEILAAIEGALGSGMRAFMHPARGPQPADYVGEDKSKFEIWHVFGWPWETTAAMARIVFSGLFERNPGAVIITHHLGGMVPFYADRIKNAYDQFGARTPDENYEEMLRQMPKHPVEYFRMFHGDTGIYGGPRSIETGVDFFGVHRVLWGSDMPFDKEGGSLYIRLSIEALEATNLSPQAKSAIFEGNARRILGLDREGHPIRPSQASVSPSPTST